MIRDVAVLSAIWLRVIWTAFPWGAVLLGLAREIIEK